MLGDKINILAKNLPKNAINFGWNSEMRIAKINFNRKSHHKNSNKKISGNEFCKKGDRNQK